MSSALEKPSERFTHLSHLKPHIAEKGGGREKDLDTESNVDKRIFGTKVHARRILRHFDTVYTGERSSREKKEEVVVWKELTWMTVLGRQAYSIVSPDYEFPEAMHQGLKVTGQTSFSIG